jgi:hypothetical protein
MNELVPITSATLPALVAVVGATRSRSMRWSGFEFEG